MHHPIDRITHTMAFVTPVVEHLLERVIAQWVHPMKDRSDDPSHHERMLLPQSYISLLKTQAETVTKSLLPLDEWNLVGIHRMTERLPISFISSTNRIYPFDKTEWKESWLHGRLFNLIGRPPVRSLAASREPVE